MLSEPINFSRPVVPRIGIRGLPPRAGEKFQALENSASVSSKGLEKSPRDLHAKIRNADGTISTFSGVEPFSSPSMFSKSLVADSMENERTR